MSETRRNNLYESARQMFMDGFAIMVIDATDIPDELLGEIVELRDYCYPTDSVEPLFDLSNGMTVLMSYLDRIYA